MRFLRGNLLAEKETEQAVPPCGAKAARVKNDSATPSRKRALLNAEEIDSTGRRCFAFVKDVFANSLEWCGPRRAPQAGNTA